jgi:hypothetical protein
VLAGVFCPILFLLFLVAVIKCFQYRCRHVLPRKLQNWKWLPKPLRSLQPYLSG